MTGDVYDDKQQPPFRYQVNHLCSPTLGEEAEQGPGEVEEEGEGEQDGCRAVAQAVEADAVGMRLVGMCVYKSVRERLIEGNKTIMF